MVKARVVLRRKTPADLSGQRTQTLRLGGEAVQAAGAGCSCWGRSSPVAGGHPLGPAHSHPPPRWVEAVPRNARELWAGHHGRLHGGGGGACRGCGHVRGPAILQGLRTKTGWGTLREAATRHTLPPRTIQPKAEGGSGRRQRQNPLMLNRLHFGGIFLKATPRSLFPFAAFPFILCFSVLEIFVKLSTYCRSYPFSTQRPNPHEVP